jgi:2-haloacid dehalogenase/putative hydrolase of the HAD superfamily
MRHDFEYITFDCYGTLIDWEAGISEATIKECQTGGIEIDRAEVLRLHAEIEPEVQSGPYRPYREVLTEVALRMAERLHWSADPARSGFLADSLPAWRPFADTNPALQRLQRAGIKFGILSNIDDDLLKGTLHHLTVPFDMLITAQQVRSYKPAPRHFHEARKCLAGKRWLHAAQSYFHDIEPAATLGIPVVWVNRKHEQASGKSRPDAEVDTLTGLADLLGVD